MEVLDPESVDDKLINTSGINYSSFSKKLGLLQVNPVIFSNSTRKNFSKEHMLLSDLLFYVQAIFYTIKADHWGNILSKVLYSYTNLDSSRSSVSSCFLSKYRFYFRKRMHRYKIGAIHYDDNVFLNKIAIQYVYLLYVVIQKNDIFFFLEVLQKFSLY
nr:hypothetical protein [Pseudoerythrocladia kornmannii]